LFEEIERKFERKSVKIFDLDLKFWILPLKNS
jgi:hypothetical protein